MVEKSLRIVVSGRVQGVWFRAWTVEQARARGLRGWVRNRADGTVEAVFAGGTEAVDEMVAACRRGPPMAQVDDVKSVPAEAPDGPGFDYRPTV